MSPVFIPPYLENLADSPVKPERIKSNCGVDGLTEERAGAAPDSSLNHLTCCWVFSLSRGSDFLQCGAGNTRGREQRKANMPSRMCCGALPLLHFTGASV